MVILNILSPVGDSLNHCKVDYFTEYGSTLFITAYLIVADRDRPMKHVANFSYSFIPLLLHGLQVFITLLDAFLYQFDQWFDL